MGAICGGWWEWGFSELTHHVMSVKPPIDKRRFRIPPCHRATLPMRAFQTEPVGCQFLVLG